MKNPEAFQEAASIPGSAPEWKPKWNGGYFIVSIEAATELKEDPRYREILEIDL